MMWIVRVALKRPYTFVAAAVLVTVFGILSILRMPIDVLPDVDIPVVSVIWQYNGLSAEEMEKRIVTPTERTFTTTVNDIEHQESQSLNGIGVERIYFQPGVNIQQAIAQVTASSQSVLRRLPPGTSAPLIIQYSASNVPVLQLSISSKTLSEQQLFDYATNSIRTPLTKVKGSQLPLPYGGKPRSILVDLDPEALFAYNIAPSEVSNAINAQNVILPAGVAKIGGTQYDVRLNGSPSVADALNDIPIRAVNGKMVYIRDVAQVRDGFSIQQNIVRSDGRRSVLLTLRKNGNVSTLAVIEGVKKALAGVRSQVPSELEIRPLFDQSVFVRESINGVLIEGGIAACLTAAMILLFLGSWRSTFIVAISIPLAILCSLICLAALGQTLNIETLGGLALAVGILVDDATVEIENIHRNLAQGKPIRRAILDGAQEIALPALVSTLSICIVFAPVFLIAGPAKSLFTPLAMAVIFAMLASYLISRTLIPTMVMYLVRDEAELHIPEGTPEYEKAKKRREEDDKKKKRKSKDPHDNILWKIHEKFEKWFDKMRDGYKKRLSWCVDNPKLIFAAFGILAAVSFCLFPFLGRDFFPRVDAGQIQLHVRAPAGTRLETTEQIFAQVEDEIRKTIPPSDLELILDNIGISFGGVNLAFSSSSVIGPSDGTIQIALKEKHKTSTDEYVSALRKRLAKRFPDLTIYFENADIVGQVLNFGVPSALDIQVTGPPTADKDNLALAQKLVGQIKGVPGTADVYLQQEIDNPVLQLSVDRIRAAQLGLTERDVANSILVSLSGTDQTAPNFFLDPRNGISYSIVVQTPQYRINSMDSLLNTPVLAAAAASSAGSSGGSLTAINGTQPQLLRNLVEVSRDRSLANINHYDANPVYSIQSSIEGRDLGGVATDIQKITKKLKLPRGSRVEVRGQSQSMNDSFRGLAIGLGLAILMVYVLMAINFQSWVDPLVVLLALPGAISGMIWMMFVTQTTISVPAMMGAIMGVGVATANAILVVTFANEQRVAGKSAREAAIEAGFTRIRPVIMTALAMILGMLPMALGLSEGGEQNAPLGRAVIGGLLFATVSTLFFVPTAYAVMRKAELSSPFETEEREEAEYERDNNLDYDESLPDEIVEAAKKDGEKNRDDDKKDAGADKKDDSVAQPKQDSQKDSAR